jgi:hypothetical protein
MKAQAIRLYAAVAAVVGLSAVSAPARAAFVVTFAEVGSDVVATGTGSINLAGLSEYITAGFSAGVFSSYGYLFTGASNSAVLFRTVTGPSSFGTAPFTPATMASGDLVGFSIPKSYLGVPRNYVSGAPLADTSTYAGRTLADLGLIPGSYVYALGSGLNPDTFTLNIGVAPVSVPEPTSLVLFGAGLMAVGFVRRRWQASARLGQ